MKIYVRAMSLERSRALIQAKSYADSVIEHIIKILMYSDIRRQDVDHWISEIARWLEKVDNITVKPKDKKLKLTDLKDSIFSAMGDDIRDYEREFDMFLFHNKKGYFNYEDKESYPEFDVTEEACEAFMDCCYDIIEKTTPMLIDKQDHSKEEYKEVLTNIFNRYI